MVLLEFTSPGSLWNVGKLQKILTVGEAKKVKVNGDGAQIRR